MAREDGRSRRRSLRGADEQVPRGRRPVRAMRSSRASARAPSRTRSCRCCAARRSRTRACRPCSMRWSITCRRRSTFRRSRASWTNGQRRRAQGQRRRAVLRAGVQAHDRPVRRPADLLPRLFRRAEIGRHHLQPDHGQQGAHRPHPADAGQQARGNQGSLRRRHRRGRGPEGHHHRRHAVRSDKIIILERICSRSRSSHVAVEPKTKADQEKMGIALQRLAEEDPTFRVHTDEETGQTIISGMGELHLEIIVDRMKREFKVEANVGAPQVAYRETITKPVESRRQVHPPVRRPRPVRPRRGSRSSPASRARASSSSTRSWAARCPANTSRRSRRASETLPTACSRATRWST